jgi:glycosyltransferase involved in cell wall biosynthesis
VNTARLAVYLTGVGSFFTTLVKVMMLRCQIVHLNAHMLSWSHSRYLNGLAALYPILFRLSGKRVVVTLHNMPDFVDVQKISGNYHIGFGARLLGRLAVWLYCRANVVCVTVKHYEQYLRSKYRARVVFVEHGCYEPTEFSQSRTRKILAFGYITPYKDYETLFRAFRRVASFDPSAQLVIAGTSHPFFPEMLSRVKNAGTDVPNLSFVGHVEEDQISGLFDSAAVVVLPYLTSTGTSGVFHMACCHGRAVIASDTPEFRALVKEGAAALIFRTRDEKELADQMIRILTVQDLRHEMETLNYKFATDNSIDRSSKKYVGIYSDLADRDDYCE